MAVRSIQDSIQWAEAQHTAEARSKGVEPPPEGWGNAAAAPAQFGQGLEPTAVFVLRNDGELHH